MAPPPRPQWDMAAGNGSAGTPTRHTAGTDGARLKNGALARCKCGLLAPRGTAVNLADAGYLGSADGHEATDGTAGQDRRETWEGDETRQRALPARRMQGASDEGLIPHERSRTLNECGRQWGERGGWDPPPISVRPWHAARYWEGDPKHVSAHP